MVLESLDSKKSRLVTNPNHKVSVLSDISIYTNTEEGAIPLENVLRKIFVEFREDPGIDSKSTPEELLSFIEYLIPEYDKDRVYPSDIKKLVSWYNILLREAPDLLKEPQESKVDDEPINSKKEETSKPEKKTKKEAPAKKKSATSKKAK